MAGAGDGARGGAVVLMGSPVSCCVTALPRD